VKNGTLVPLRRLDKESAISSMRGYPLGSFDHGEHGEVLCDRSFAPKLEYVPVKNRWDRFTRTMTHLLGLQDGDSYILVESHKSLGRYDRARET
jgi:hypothetical protein